MQAKEIIRFQLPPIDCPLSQEPSYRPRQPKNSLTIPPLSVPVAQSSVAQAPADQSSVAQSPADQAPADQSSESISPPDRLWLSQSGFAVSAALALTSVAVLLSHAPVYEGQFVLDSDASGTPTPQPDRVVPAVPVVPQIDRATVSQILESPRVLAPVFNRLNAEHRSLDYETLTRNLTVEVQGNRLEVRYRDQDPERLEAVLQTLSQRYVQYSHECRSRQCLGLNYIEAQLPEVQQQVDRLRTEMQQLQQQFDLSNLDVQVRWFSKRSEEMAKQALIVKLDRIKAQNQYASLQQRLRLNPQDSLASRLLRQDARYLPLLSQLQQVDRLMAEELTRLSPNAAQMQTLMQQYQLLQMQLEQIAQTVLPAYLSNPYANLQDPILQTPATLALLQQAIGAIHHLQMLQVRQETIDFAQQQIAVRSQEIAEIMGQHDRLEQEYTAQTLILQQYLEQQARLTAAIPTQQWKLVAPPEIGYRPLEAMERSISWQEATGILALGAVALGVGIAAAKIRQQETRRWQEHLEISVEA